MTKLNDMKALSINQPWAWLIVNGYKTVENRDWNTKYRGEFLIHAGKRFDNDGYDDIKELFPAIPLPNRDDFEMGGIVGKARLINTVHINDKKYVLDDDKPWFFGEYGFMLSEGAKCDLKPCKGALGFFTPDYNSRYAEPKKSSAKMKRKAQAELQL